MATAPWLAALNARSRGMNQRYGLGQYKPGIPDAPNLPPSRPPAAPPPDPYAQAKQGVQAIIDAMMGQVQAQQDAARAAAQREADQDFARGQAVAQALQALGISGNVQAAFRDAANAQAGLAQGFSGQIRDQAAAQAADQARQLSGTGQEAAVRNQGDNMGNVQYGVGGYMPSTALTTMGAAFGADAALQPGFATQFGALDQAKRLQDFTNTELPQFDQQRSEIAAKLPQLYQQLLGDQFDRDNELYRRRLATRDYNDKRKAAAAAAKQDAADRRIEAIALKMSYGQKLSRSEQRLLDTYGLSSQTANTLIRGRQQAVAAQAKADLQAAKDRAAAARARFSAAKQAAREAKAQAARSKLEADKAAYRSALEAQKTAQRIMQDAVKAVTSAAKKAGSKGNPGDSADAGSADSFFGG